MKTNAVAKHYGRLTPEERFRLILAARGRGDQAERDRLVNAGQRISLSLPDHVPYEQAFEELALLIFIESLEEAAQYLDALAHADDVADLFGDDEAEDDDQAQEAEGDASEEEVSQANAAAESRAEESGKRSLCERSLDRAYAAGFILRTKAEGWKLFCKRMTITPFLLWEILPGFDRLQRALKLSEEAAFDLEGFLHWLNGVRPAGEPERAEVPLTVERVAASTEELYRKLVQCWCG